jgi:hypothetical protein
VTSTFDSRVSTTVTVCVWDWRSSRFDQNNHHMTTKNNSTHAFPCNNKIHHIPIENDHYDSTIATFRTIVRIRIIHDDRMVIITIITSTSTFVVDNHDRQLLQLSSTSLYHTSSSSFIHDSIEETIRRVSVVHSKPNDRITNENV